ncbi:MAG: hypothetical protein ACOX6T_00085 [Myxococcales bacterium]|jgi:glycine cleavage system regulatory protein
MKAGNRNGRSTRTAGSNARAVKRSMVTLGDLLAAAYEVGGSADAVATLLSPLSPLSKMLDKRIVIAGA